MKPSPELVVDKAGRNMPNDNIDRAIKKGPGELASDAISGLVYEDTHQASCADGDILTDSQNRASELRRSLIKRGRLGSPGSVSWMFDRRSVELQIPSLKTICWIGSGGGSRRRESRGGSPSGLQPCPIHGGASGHC